MQTDAPLITTIIPTYRRPKLLKRAIRSVLNQTYPNFRICVYDNASGDETAEVVAEFAKEDSRIKYFCHKENIGGIANFIFGMQQVETPFFSILSDDDILLPEFYESAVGGLEKYPDAIFWGGLVIEMTDKAEVSQARLLSWSREGYFTPPEGLFEMIEGKHPILTGILFRKELIETLGVFDPSIGPIVDLELELRIAAHRPFVVSQKPCGIFLLHSGSLSMISQASFLYNDYPKMIDKFKKDEGLSQELRNQIEARLTKFFQKVTFRSGIYFTIHQDFEEANRAAKFLSTYYRNSVKSFSLRATILLCQKIKPVFKLFGLFYKLRKNLVKSNTNQLQDKYGDLARFL